MKRHSLLAVLRVVLAIIITYAMAFSNTHWGHPGFHIVLVSMVLGGIAALVFLLAGSLAQFFLRKRTPLYTFLFDMFLFALFTGTLVYAGVVATEG